MSSSEYVALMDVGGCGQDKCRQAEDELQFIWETLSNLLLSIENESHK